MFQINLSGGEPIFQQLREQVIRFACIGVLKPGEQLPSVRSVARELGINPNTVAKAYAELERDGIIYSAAGKGSFVAENILSLSAVRSDVLSDFVKAARKAMQLGITKQELENTLRQLDAAEGGNER